MIYYMLYPDSRVFRSINIIRKMNYEPTFFLKIFFFVIDEHHFDVQFDFEHQFVSCFSLEIVCKVIALSRHGPGHGFTFSF